MSKLEYPFGSSAILLHRFWTALGSKFTVGVIFKSSYCPQRLFFSFITSKPNDFFLIYHINIKVNFDIKQPNFFVASIFDVVVKSWDLSD